MLRMLAAMLINNWLILYELVFLTEAYVAIGMQLRDMLWKVFNVNRMMQFTADIDGLFEINIRQWLRLIRIVQIVIVWMKAFAVIKWTKERFKSWSKHLSHDFETSRLIFFFFLWSTICWYISYLYIKKFKRNAPTHSELFSFALFFPSTESDSDSVYTQEKRVLSLTICNICT